MRSKHSARCCCSEVRLDLARVRRDRTTKIGLQIVEAGIGRAVGLDDQWTARAIKAVGNYGEMFDRDLGENPSLKMPRGPNFPWNRGGLIYARPFGL